MAFPLKTLVSILSVFSVFTLLSCNENTTSSEIRELTTLDKKPVPLSPTSADRFAPPQVDGEGSSTSSSLVHITPEGWELKETSMFRSVNMALPEGGECYVSEVGGGLLDNVNRWFGQFKQPKKSIEELSAEDRLVLMGKEGYFVKAEGNYNPGMGKPVREDVILLGAITQTENGLITVKLIASKEEAIREEANFKLFCRSISRN